MYVQSPTHQINIEKRSNAGASERRPNKSEGQILSKVMVDLKEVPLIKPSKSQLVKMKRLDGLYSETGPIFPIGSDLFHSVETNRTNDVYSCLLHIFLLFQQLPSNSFVISVLFSLALCISSFLVWHVFS